MTDSPEQAPSIGLRGVQPLLAFIPVFDDRRPVSEPATCSYCHLPLLVVAPGTSDLHPDCLMEIEDDLAWKRYESRLNECEY